MLFFRSVLFLFLIFGVSFSLPLYDPTQPLELLYTFKPHPIQTYALIITAQSTASGNFFVFSPDTPTFSNFISTFELTQTTQTITLTFQNELTNQQAIDLNIDISSCLQEFTYDCTASEFPMPICSILAPTPSTGNKIQRIKIQDIDCTSGDSNPICSSTLWRDTLTDIDSNDIFMAGYTFCPGASVQLQIKVPLLRAYIPPSTLIGTGDISFHYRSLIPASTNSFTVSGSTTRIDKSSQITSDINLESFSDTSFTSRSDLKTIIQTQIIKHDYAADIYCQYEVEYTGFIRGVYANDLPGPAHMPRNLDMSAQSTAQSTIRLPMRANQLNFINIFGNQLSDTELTFNYCYPDWRNENALSVSIENYILGNIATLPEDYTVQSTPYACQNNCFRCTPDFLCIESAQFLAYGGCQATCSQTFPIPDYKNVCNSVLESATFVIDSLPQVTSTAVTLTLYNDLEVSSPFALVLSATNKVYLTITPYSFPFGAPMLPQSIPIILESFTYGEQTITALLTSVGSTAHIAQANQDIENRITDVSYVLNGLTPILEQVNALYYLLDDSSPGFVLTSWNKVPATLIEKQNPLGMLICENNEYQHLVGVNYYIAQAFLNCVADCKLQIRSDGHIMAYLNEQTLLFDLDFKSLWTYTYPQSFIGFLDLKLVITGATYFQPFVTGSDYQLFIPSNPIAAHPISPLPVDQHSCDISNCLNCKDLMCYSCEEGYLLSTDETTCLSSCTSGLESPIEGICLFSTCLNNQVIVATEDLCLPSCDQPGEIYMPGEGCQLCVPECQVCSGANTCAQCKFSDPSNTNTYCARKGGSLYATNTPDFSVSQTVTIFQNIDKELALVVTDQAAYSDFSFYFANDQRKIPRILKSIKMDTTDPTASTATLPPLTISQSGKITLHYLDITPDVGGEQWSISGFVDQVYRDWPRQDQIAWTDTVVGALTYEHMVNNFQGLPLDNRGYYTMLLSKLYSHDQPDPVTCQIELQFYGEIRGLYVNGELVLSESTSNYVGIIRNSRSFTLNPHELAFINIVGCRIQIESFALTSCSIDSSPVSPVFKSYVITGSDANSDTFHVTSNTECGQNCLACRDQDSCIICERNHYLNDEGKCQPKCSNPSAIQYLSGYCQTVDRSQGYLVYNDYVFGTQTKVSDFILYLDLDVQLLALLHPYPLSATNHAAFAFVSNDNPSLAQGAYELWDYTKTQTYVNMTMQVQSSVTGKGNLLATMLLTIRKDYGLLYYYLALPTTLNQWISADGFDYLPLTQNILALQDSSAFYFYDFFLDCSGVCEITFQAHGNVEITANERTFVFSSFLEAAIGPVTLKRTFSGLQHLVFTVWKSNQFEYSISASGGDYYIFSHGDLIIHQDTNDLPEQLCSQENCVNCYQSTCLSCSSGFFLDQDTGSCLNQCPPGTQANLAERLCGPTICGPLVTSSQYVLRDGYCVWNCIDSPGFYYDISEGCTQPCDSTCQTCGGPDANQCLSCDSSRSLQSDNTCPCASGYKLNTATGDCDVLPTVQIKVDSFSDLCSNIVFHAEIPSSFDANSIVLYWDLESSSNPDLTAQTSIQTILNSQHSNVVSFPKVWIDNSYSYKISVYYIYDTTETISNSIIFDNSQIHLSSFSFVNGNSQSIKSYLNNIFQIQFADASCVIPPNSLTLSWSGISDVELPYNPNFPLRFMLPSCSINPSSVVSITVKVSLANSPGIHSEQTLTLQALQETFEAFIATNNQNHPRNSDLILQGDIDYYDKCVSRALGQISYTWLCDDTTDPANIIPCNNDLGLFGVARTTNQIIVPSTGFNWGNDLLITLLVKKNEVVQSSTLPISIADTNQLIVKISCATLDCLRYAPNQEFLFSATVSAAASGTNTMPRELTWAERSKLTFTWNVYPSVPFVYFEETLKLFSSALQLPENIDTITVELVVKNATKIGTASLILPINRPPVLGTFSAIPLTGTSLSTLFTLQADGWQDDDISLTYQFYYSFPSDVNAKTLLADYGPRNSIISMLPGQRPTGPVLLQLSVRDYFGAETTMTTQVQVSPQDLTLQEALDSYNQILQAVQDNGNFQVTQTITMITKELNDWENLLTENSPDPVCPSCSGRGYCSSDLARCVCESGWAMYDCSLTQSNVSAINGFKQVLLEEIIQRTTILSIENVTGFPSRNTDDLIYAVLKGSCHNQHFNSNKTLTLTQNILEDSLGVFNSDTVLTPEQAIDLAQILSDMMTFSATFDCNKSTEFTQDLETKTQQYLEKIAQSSLSGKIINENATIIGTYNIDMYFRKLSICSVNNLVVSPATPASPQVTININAGLTANCSSGVNLELYTFNDDLLNCSKEVTTDNNKTIIGINLTYPDTGKTPPNVTVIIDFDGDKSKCPSACQTLVDNLCYCTDLSPFDVTDQIKKVFGDSNLDYLTRIESLVHFKFWNSAIFWLLFAFTLWFVITLFVIVKKISNYDRISIFQKIIKKSKFLILRTVIMVTHPLTSIYCVRKREELSKTTRALLFYSRTLLTLGFASIFSGPSQNDTSDTYKILTISLNFNIYEFLLPYFSIIPLSMLIEWLLKTEIKREKLNKVQGKKNIKFFFNTFKLNFGYIVTGASILGCLLAILIIGANMSPLQKLAWIVNFAQLLLQDNLLNYIVFFTLQCFFLRLYYRYPNDPTIQKKLRSWLDDEFWEVMQLTNEPVKIQIKAKSIQTIYPEPKGLNQTSISERPKLPLLLLHSSTLMREESTDKSPYSLKTNTQLQLQENTPTLPSIQIVSPMDSDVLLSKSHQTFAFDFKELIQKQRDLEDTTPTKIFSKTPLSFETTFYNQNSKRLSFNSAMNGKKISIDTHETSQISIDANISPSPFHNKRLSFISSLNTKGLNSPTSAKTDGSNQELESGDEQFSPDHLAAMRIRNIRNVRQRSAIPHYTRKKSLFKNLPDKAIVVDENNAIQSVVEIGLESDRLKSEVIEAKKAASDDPIRNNEKVLIQREQREAILKSIKRKKIELDLQEGDQLFS